MSASFGKVKYVNAAAKSYVQRLAEDGQWKSIWNATFLGHAEATQAVYTAIISSVLQVVQDDLDEVKSMMKAGESMSDVKLAGYSLEELYWFRDIPEDLPSLDVGKVVPEPVAEADDWCYEEGGEEEEPEGDEEVNLSDLWQSQAA